MDNNLHSGEDLLESNRPVVYIIVNEKEKLRVSLSKINCEVKSNPAKKIFQPHVKNNLLYCFGFKRRIHPYVFV